RKALNEHLAPLRRYLACQVGKHWNKVFADICRHLDRNSAVQDHVRDHLADFVAIRVIVHHGILCHGDHYGVGRSLYTPFYVCPRTGILRKNPGYRRASFMRIKKLHVRLLQGDTALVRKDRVWYVITFSTVPDLSQQPGYHSHIPRGQLAPWDAL